MPRNEGLTEAELTDLTKYAAYIVVRYGDVYAPVFERLERELIAVRSKSTPADRARKFFDSPDVRAAPATLQPAPLNKSY